MRHSQQEDTPLLLVVDHYDSFTYSLVRYLTLLGFTSDVVEHDRFVPELVQAPDDVGADEAGATGDHDPH